MQQIKIPQLLILFSAMMAIMSPTVLISTAQAAPAKRPGYAVGRVVNSAGQPIEGVKVAIYGTTMAGANTRFEAQSDAQGQFSQRVPEGIYGLTAYYEVRFNDKNYRFTLPPTDGITAAKHDSAEGIVKEFVWRIHGLRPNQTPGEGGAHTEPMKYFGGYVYLTSKEAGFIATNVYFPAGSTLEITMTPRGPLIDGSEGQPKTFRRTFEKDVISGISWHLSDVPIGLYTMTAKVTSAGGASKNLNLRKSLDFSGQFTPNIPVDFEPTSYGDMQMMQVTVEP